MSFRPPLLACLVLRLIPQPHRDYVSGDLHEEYAESVLPCRGRFAASMWFFGQSVRTVIAFVHRPPITMRRRTRLWPAREVRFAYRSLRRCPGFALLAVATLAVGIGATTSVFSAANWILFRPVPGVRNPGGIVVVSFQNTEGEATGVSRVNLQDLASSTPGLTHMAGHTTLAIQASSAVLSPIALLGEAVNGDYFELLGVRAELGRVISRAEADDGVSEAVTVLSYDLWNREFGRSPDVVGSTVRLNGHPFRVVGVTDRRFQGVDRMASVDLWVPGARYADLRHAPAALGWTTDSRAPRIFTGVLGRLADGVKPGVVENQLRTAMAGLSGAYPDENGIYEVYVPTVFEGIGLEPWLRGSVTATVRTFFAVAAIVLLIGCANVANLLIVRGVRRRCEIALRRALGAAKGQLYLQHLIESLLLSVPATLLGLWFATALNRFVWSAGFLTTGPLPTIAVDGRVAAFAGGVAVLTTLSFGLVPALAASGVDVVEHLKVSARTASRRVTLLQGSLTVVQLALSLSLLTAAVGLVRTVVNLHHVDLGFSPEGITLYTLDPAPQGYSSDAFADFHLDVLQAVRRVPGVTASAAVYEPFSGLLTFVRVNPPDKSAEPIRVRGNWIADEYFEVMGIPILEGRGFRPNAIRSGSRDASDAAILSERMAYDLFGHRSAIGRTVTVGSFSGTVVRRVVGVVGDVVSWDRRSNPPAMVYLPLADMPIGWATLLIRTPMPRDALDRAVVEAVADVDPNVPITRSDAMTNRVERSLAQELSLTRLVRLLAALAAGLAGVGLYSVIAYVTAERTKEFGIRVALGASRGGIVRIVMRRSLLFGAIGVVLGVMASAAFSQVFRNRLFGVDVLDPASLGLAAAALLALSTAAAVAPALTALGVDPVKSLGSE